MQLLHLKADLLDQLSIHVVVVSQYGAELIGGVRLRDSLAPAHPLLPYLGVSKDLLNLLIQKDHDLFRGSGGSEYALPARGVVSGQSALRDGRHIGYGFYPLLARYAYGSKLILAYMREEEERVIPGEMHPAFQKVRHGRCGRPAVRDVQHFDPRHGTK